MGTECYAMVRGSSLRVTGLDRLGRVHDDAAYAVSKSVATVRINEVSESSNDDRMKTPEGERRLRLQRSAQTIRYTADIDFVRVDPGLFGLIAGVPVIDNAASDAVGFDSMTKTTTVGFALEVWSKLAGEACAPSGGGFGEGGFGEMGFGEGTEEDPDEQGRRWGYTLFPYLRGGRLGGFQFANGLVSFSLIGAQTRKAPGWGVGPFDLNGYQKRLITPVSRNTTWRTYITPAAPPSEFDGTRTLSPDVIDNGTPTNPMPDPDAPLVVSGGGVETSSYIISGGRP